MPSLVVVATAHPAAVSVVAALVFVGVVVCVVERAVVADHAQLDAAYVLLSPDL